MGIYEVATRAIKKSPVTFLDSTLATKKGYLKLINYKLEVAKAKGKFNRVGVASADTTIAIGDIVNLDGEQYIVGSVTPDIYKDTVIRYVCELFFCDVLCDVDRRTIQRDDDDSIIGSVDVFVHQNLPVSWQVSDLFVKGDRDQTTEYYNALISIHHFNAAPIIREDKFHYHGDEYEVKFFRWDTPGVVSIRVEPASW